MGRLEKRVAIVTGAARGLGEGVAKAFAKEGAVVVAADVLDAAGVVENLPGSAEHRAISLDISDRSAVDDAFATVRRDYGSLDVLVNVAGVGQPIAPLVDTSDEIIDRILDVNIKGLLACCRAAAMIMKDQGHGRIINTASQAGKQAWPGLSVYSGSKAATIAITQSLALELAPDVIVNCVCPGTMLTEMARGSFQEIGAAEARDGDDLLREKAQSIPLKRLGTAEDMGAMCVFLASDEARFTTGAAFNLTGGECVFF